MAVIDPIDPFASGVDVSSTDTTMQDLAGRIKEKQNYDQNFAKYQQRLAPYSYQAPSMSFYELASELGAGLLSTPNIGGASAFTGLGVGFTKASEKMRDRKEANDKENQQMALQAAQMAMQDEQKAEEYLHAINLKRLEIANEPGDWIYLEGVATDKSNKLLKKETTMGDTQKLSLRDNAKNRALLNELTQNQGYYVVDKPDSVVNIDQTSETREDIDASRELSALQTKLVDGATAANSIKSQVSYARGLSNRITENGQYPERFGKVAEVMVPVKNMSQGLGFDWAFDTTGLDDQDAIRQVNLGFVMRLVSMTKGAISNREMELFQQSAPTLGSTYGGYQEMLNYLDIMAKLETEFAEAFIDEKSIFKNQYKADNDTAKVSTSELWDHMTKFQLQWQRENSMFDRYAKEYGKNAGPNNTNLTGNDYYGQMVNSATSENVELWNKAVDNHAAATSGNRAEDNPFNPQSVRKTDLLAQRKTITEKLENNEYVDDNAEKEARKLLQQINTLIANLQ